MSDANIERMVDMAILRQENAALKAEIARLEAAVDTMGDVMSHRLSALTKVEELAWLILDQTRETKT